MDKKYCLPGQQGTLSPPNYEPGYTYSRVLQDSNAVGTYVLYIHSDQKITKNYV